MASAKNENVISLSNRGVAALESGSGSSGGILKQQATALAWQKSG